MSADLDLRALRELAEAATPGPWWADDFADVYAPDSEPDAYDGRRMVAGADCCGGVYYPPDAAFIAAANPTAVLVLIERVEAAEAESARLRSIIESARNTCSRSPLCVPYAKAD